MHVHLVLQEDVYETCFGDGYYAYLCAAFADIDAAHAWATKAESKDYKYHLRTAELSTTADGKWVLDVALQNGDRADAAEVAQLLGLIAK